MDFEAFVIEIDKYLDKGNYAQVIEEISNLRGEWSSDPTILLKYAEALSHVGESVEAKSIYTELLEQYPDLSWAYVGLAKLYQAAHQYDNALSTVELGLGSCPEDGALLLVKTNVLVEMGETGEALDILDRLLQVNPKDRWLNLSKLDALNTAELFDDAVKFAESLYEILLLDEVLLYRHAIALTKSKKYKKNAESCLFLLNQAIVCPMLHIDSALNIMLISSKHLAIKDQLLYIESLKHQLREEERQLFNVQILFLLFGANYAFKAVIRSALISDFAVLSRLKDVFISSGNITYLISLLRNVDVELSESMILSLHTLLARAGRFEEAHELLSGSGLSSANFFRTSEALYFEGLPIESLKLTEQILESEPDVKRMAWLLAAFVECESSTAESCPNTCDALQQFVIANEARTFQQRIFKASFANNSILERTEFGIAIQTVCSFYEKQRADNVPTISNSVIPREIVQYWNLIKPPLQLQCNINTWSTSLGFKHSLYSMTTAIDLFSEHFDQSFIDTIKRCALPEEQADFFRLCYLWEFGGVYSDCDDILVGDLNQLLLSDKGLILPREPFGVGTNFIAAKPKHPVIAATLEKAKKALLNRLQIMTWMKTGPGLLISCLGDYINWCDENHQPPDVHILSPEEFRSEVTSHCHYPNKGHQGWVNFMQL